jgi:cysteine desulfuration protein SufE
MTATIDDLIDDLELLGDDWEERYGYIIGLAKQMPAFSELDRTDDNKVHGCQSQVWLTAKTIPGIPPRLEFRGDSDAFITKGLVAIILLAFSGKTPREILNYDVEDMLRRIGLDRHLSPTRSNGLHAMVKRVRSIAANAEGLCAAAEHGGDCGMHCQPH